jgi:hypothetical protein
LLTSRTSADYPATHKCRITQTPGSLWEAWPSSTPGEDCSPSAACEAPARPGCGLHAKLVAPQSLLSLVNSDSIGTSVCFSRFNPSARKMPSMLAYVGFAVSGIMRYRASRVTPAFSARLSSHVIQTPGEELYETPEGGRPVRGSHYGAPLTFGTREK